MKNDKDRCGSCAESKPRCGNDVVEIVIKCRKHGIVRAANAFCIESTAERIVSGVLDYMKNEMAGNPEMFESTRGALVKIVEAKL